MGKHQDELLEVGLNLLWRGYSVIPLNRKKVPFASLLPLIEEADEKTGEIKSVHSWKPFQTERATDDEFERWNRAGAQLGLVCGNISGGLLVLDFDLVRNGTECYYDRWANACEAQGYRVRRLPTQRTGSGGMQVAVRCANPGGNTKLAWVKDETEKLGRKVAIETRGEGGYIVAAPSLHPNGNRYKMLHGQLHEAPLAPQERVNAIVEIARSFNQVSEPERKRVVRADGAIDINDENSVIERYNSLGTTYDELLKYGYRDAGRGRMLRPDATRISTPGVEFFENGRSWHWSSNDPLSNGMPQDRFAVRCFFEFNDDITEAVRVIAGELGMGYGMRPPVMRAGAAYCPDHPFNQLQKTRKHWHCTARVGDGWCGYWWQNDEYKLLSVKERIAAMRRAA